MTCATDDDCAALSALCLRAKAHWGYSATFMAACKDELTVQKADLNDLCAVISDAGQFIGYVRVSLDDTGATLEKLYVTPSGMGEGHGRALFEWACAAARSAGAHELAIVSDPNAAAFYHRLGARRVGDAPSGSIPGRTLPVLRYDLTG
nr:GNAT family N-acetyltransferase [Cognatishimia sp. F0-27]